ncbi:MAG: hypothetical protein RLZZ408_290 [Verrucomicrobiota bacterium]
MMLARKGTGVNPAYPRAKSRSLLDEIPLFRVTAEDVGHEVGGLDFGHFQTGRVPARGRNQQLHARRDHDARFQFRDDVASVVGEGPYRPDMAERHRLRRWRRFGAPHSKGVREDGKKARRRFRRALGGLRGLLSTDGDEGASTCKKCRKEKREKQMGCRPHPSLLLPAGEEINTDALLPR